MPQMHRSSPVFFWQEYGMWCAVGYDQVNTFLRDRRLGRENRWGAPLEPGPRPRPSQGFRPDRERIACWNASLLPIRA
jgi:hypothetical protein